MTDRFVAAFVALAVLSPTLAHAQTNLDQGKSPAQIFAIDCAECHSSVHGLAKGKDNSTLTEFLREHYTTSREQAAGLAAFVLGGRATETGQGARGRSQRPATDRASASAEEPRANHHRRGKPEDGRAAGRPQRSTERPAKPTAEAMPEPTMMSPLGRPETGQSDHRSASVSRSHRKEPKNVLPAPAPPPLPAQDQSTAQEPAAAAPSTAASMDHAPTGAPAPEATPAAGAPPEAASESGESAPMPRDNIPD